MGNENMMRAAEIEQQANNAQKDVMREKQEGLNKVNELKRESDEKKNQAMYFRTEAAGMKDNRNKEIQIQARARQMDAKAAELREKAKQLEKDVLSSTQDKDFKIKEMFDAARKLRTQA